MVQGNAALTIENFWEKPAANDESVSGPVYYYRARYYDPEIGRFISEDPLGFEAGINFYAYVNNNPINFNDPFGKDLFTVNAGIDIPFVGGLEAGVVFNDGSGEINGIPDLGIFGTLKKSHGGFGKAKLTLGVSQTLGSRSNFDGTDAALSVGLSPLAPVGVSLGGIGDGISGNESLGLDIGPSFGAEGQITQTFSLTVGDVVRGIGSLFQGSESSPTSSFVPTQTPAAGGFVLYPNKPNNNSLRSVYSK